MARARATTAPKQGQKPWELPESLIGSLRVSKLDCTKAAELDTSRELPLEPPPPMASPGGDGGGAAAQAYGRNASSGLDGERVLNLCCSGRIVTMCRRRATLRGGLPGALHISFPGCCWRCRAVRRRPRLRTTAPALTSSCLCVRPRPSA